MTSHLVAWVASGALLAPAAVSRPVVDPPLNAPFRLVLSLELSQDDAADVGHRDPGGAPLFRVRPCDPTSERALRYEVAWDAKRRSFRVDIPSAEAHPRRSDRTGSTFGCGETHAGGAASLQTVQYTVILDGQDDIPVKVVSRATGDPPLPITGCDVTVSIRGERPVLIGRDLAMVSSARVWVNDFDGDGLHDLVVALTSYKSRSLYVLTRTKIASALMVPAFPSSEELKRFVGEAKM